jgi:hypothetical protein
VLLQLCFRRKPSDVAYSLTSKHCFIGQEFATLAKLLAEWNLGSLRCLYQIDCDWQARWTLLLSDGSYLARLPSDVAIEVCKYMACSAEDSPDSDNGNRATVLLEKEPLLQELLPRCRAAVALHRAPADKLVQLLDSMHFVFLASGAAATPAEPVLLDHSAIAVVLQTAWLQGLDTRIDVQRSVDVIVAHYQEARRVPDGSYPQLRVSYLEQLIRLCQSHAILRGSPTVEKDDVDSAIRLYTCHRSRVKDVLQQYRDSSSVPIWRMLLLGVLGDCG